MVLTYLLTVKHSRRYVIKCIRITPISLACPKRTHIGKTNDVTINFIV